MRAKDIPPHLHERYGIRPVSPVRWVALGLALLLAVPAGIYAASRYVATQRIPFALISWSVLSNEQVQVLWKLDASDQRQWCAVSAQDFDHYDVGFAVVAIAAGTASVTYVMNVSQRPIAVELAGCASSPYALAGPQFRPGLVPPPQPAPGLAPGVVSPREFGLR
jgi:hypothetical protein